VTVAILTTSWDDGTPEDLVLGRLLAEYGYRGTFYATTGPAGRRTLDDNALLEVVSLGHEIGNHGRSHRLFTELSMQELMKEVAWAEEQIRMFAEPHAIVAPPRGLVSKAGITTLGANGFLVRTAPILGGRRQKPGLIIPSAQLYPHTRLRTYGHLIKWRSIPTVAYLKAWSRSRTVRARLGEMVSVAGDHGLLLHIWGHSREIETLGLWGELEFLLEEASERGLLPATNSEAINASKAR
jgi:hypothetical protein